MAPPYSLKKLPAEVAAALKPYAPYATTAAVRTLVDGSASPDPEALLCLAFLEWQDGLTTDFDEDVLQFGAEALATLARHPALEAHTGLMPAATPERRAAPPARTRAAPTAARTPRSAARASDGRGGRPRAPGRDTSPCA